MGHNGAKLIVTAARADYFHANSAPPYGSNPGKYPTTTRTPRREEIDEPSAGLTQPKRILN